MPRPNNLPTKKELYLAIADARSELSDLYHSVRISDWESARACIVALEDKTDDVDVLIHARIHLEEN